MLKIKKERNDKIMEIKYTRQGDYLIPNLYLDKDDDCGIIGKYGTLRLHWN